MKQNLLKLYALVIALSMLVSFAACSKNPATNDQSTAAKSSAAGSTAEKTVKVKEPVTLTFWGAQMAGNAPSGIQTDPVAQQIEKELNIKMDMETHPSDEKLAAILASNDLMDIMCVDKKYTPQMQSLVMDLEPLIEANSPDVKTNVSIEVMNYSKKYLGNGKLYYLPANLSEKNALPEQVWGGVYTRWDMYRELGYPEIKNTDDYLNLVEQMLKAYPENEEGKAYYGFSLWFDWGPYVHTNTLSVRLLGNEAFGGASSVVQINRNTFERSNIYLNPDSGFWQGVDFWYKANQRKLLDPESFTQNYDQALQKYTANRVLASVINFVSAPAWSYYTSKGTMDKGWFGPIPISGSQLYIIGANKFGANHVYAISAKSKHADRAMELINWFYSVHGCMTAQNGIEGVDWVKENGKYSYTPAYEEKFKDPDSAVKYGIRKYPNFLGISPDALIPGTSDPIDIIKSRQGQKDAVDKPENAVVKEALAHYGVEIQADVLPEGVAYSQSEVNNLMGFLPVDAPDDIKLIDQKLDNYLRQAILKIILAKNDDDFNAQKTKMMEELKELGVETVYQFWDNAIGKAVDEYKALK